MFQRPSRTKKVNNSITLLRPRLKLCVFIFDRLYDIIKLNSIDNNIAVVYRRNTKQIGQNSLLEYFLHLGHSSQVIYCILKKLLHKLLRILINNFSKVPSLCDFEFEKLMDETFESVSLPEKVLTDKKKHHCIYSMLLHNTQNLLYLLGHYFILILISYNYLI